MSGDSMEHMESKMQDQIEGSLYTFEAMCKRIERLEKLVRAVTASEFKGIECHSIDGKNWFDFRRATLDK